MAIYGIGAKYNNKDVSDIFIKDNIIGTGWDNNDAPDLHVLIKSLKIGDVIYIKSSGVSSAISVKAIGVIIDNEILSKQNHTLTEVGRNIKWLHKVKFMISQPSGKNNVRLNTIYEEFHPNVLKEIIDKL